MTIKKILSVATFALAMASLSSCVKKDDFDDSPSPNVDPDLTVNFSIAGIKLIAASTLPAKIDSDYIVSGIVTADDKSGNFYKQIVIQDSTAGIIINIDMSDYYTIYPIGRRIFVKLKGLYAANVDGTYQVGFLTAGSIDRIPSPLVSQYLVGGKWGLSVEPKKIKPSAIVADSLIAMLVTLDSVEFTAADADQPFADAITKTDLDRFIKRCGSSATMDVRTSAYADFASVNTPCKNGNLTAVYIPYSSTPQLFIRNLNDLNLTNSRCSGITDCTPTYLTIDSIRNLPLGTVLPDFTHIKGTVISDYVNKNLDSKNMVIDDGTAGICVRFWDPHSFAMNTRVDVNISGLTVDEFNGWLQVSSAELYNCKTTSGLPLINPIVKTEFEATNAFETLESRLIRINNVTLNGGMTATYQQSNISIDDGTSGSLILYTKSGATFQTVAIPTTPVSITGILTQFNGTLQFQIRNLNDVQ